LAGVVRWRTLATENVFCFVWNGNWQVISEMLGKTSFSATLSFTNNMLIALEVNLHLHNEKPMSNHLSYSIAK
jgi:hypothetical protein